MKILIVYATRHGSTLKVVERLTFLLKGEVTSVNIEKNKITNLETYDLIIVGGSIHMGRIQTAISKFCTLHEQLLLRKKLGLFLICMETGLTALQQLEGAFPESLRNHSLVIDALGGELLFDKLNLIDKFMVKKIMKVNESVHQLDETAIDAFANNLNSKL